ncbi:hypothetical protein QYF36_014543 [Acer negundo]|nr:hypothetical protein QYF36_014543 [Acer negundo]
MVYEFNGAFTPRSISSTPPTLFPANSTRRASVCSPPRNQEPSPDSPGPSGAQSTPRSWSIYGLATASLDTSSGSGELEQESSRDGGDDLGRLKKDRSSRESERNHLRGKTGYAVGDFVGVKEREEQQRDLGSLLLIGGDLGFGYTVVAGVNFFFFLKGVILVTLLLLYMYLVNRSTLPVTSQPACLYGWGVLHLCGSDLFGVCLWMKLSGQTNELKAVIEGVS